MSVIFRSRYGVFASSAMVQSSSFCRVASPRRPGTRPSTARKGDAASDTDTRPTLTVARGGRVNREERGWFAAAVDREVRTGDERRLGRREEQTRRGNVVGPHHPPHGHRGTDGSHAGRVAVVELGLLG